jgi:hypothetical protein
MRLNTATKATRRKNAQSDAYKGPDTPEEHSPMHSLAEK